MTLSPGDTIGIIGGGQLCRMMAIEAGKMGFRTATLDPNPTGPAAQFCDLTIEGKWSDFKAAKRLAEQSDVISLDTEHVPADNLEELEKMIPVRPSSSVLRIIQDRLKQREFLQKEGLPQTPFASLSKREDLEAVRSSLGENCILKARESGYDGKGQARATTEKPLGEAWQVLGEKPCMAESFIDFSKEVSLLLARDIQGNVKTYPIAENIHHNHVLKKTRVPAAISENVAFEAEKIGKKLAEGLDYVGMLAIEFFVTKDDRLLINEIAPRPHNSGHFTFGACATSQFEQHIRAVAGLPLGETTLLSPVVMLNLFGDLWLNKTPNWQEILETPQAHLHLYGKEEARPGRKMGHMLILQQNIDRALELANRIESNLYGE